jgi:hypothetical protein
MKNNTKRRSLTCFSTILEPKTLHAREEVSARGKKKKEKRKKKILLQHS